nr:Chain KM0, Transposase [Spraguea lophii 42_110]7QJH_LM0 Chain LM0, Transposase [Spraguea lophii 42_110]8BR3_LM0 Chain LM0, Transposase [Spraguea lophii 42_110]8P5D_LM0 Chain LM0, Transposase [Spraguea lophii 42_110]8P60_KM0 Chain KM0, Transposase [Spraguea lophii 42_110]8P60_LM0 Chain LM0, Transposase [Spraguea lophii 42_110]
MYFIKPGCLIKKKFSIYTSIVISVIDNNSVVIQSYDKSDNGDVISIDREVINVSKIVPIGNIDIKNKSKKEIDGILVEENRNLKNKDDVLLMNDFERFKEQLKKEVEDMVIEEMA